MPNKLLPVLLVCAIHDVASGQADKPENISEKGGLLVGFLGFVAGFFLFLAILLSIFLYKWWKKGRAITTQTNIPKREDEPLTIRSSIQNHPIFIFNDALSNIVKISHGAFGEVCKGTYYDGTTQHDVAIKTLFQFDAEKLREEAEIAASLEHPNVLQIIGICFDPNSQTLKLVLPFMENGDLASYLEKNLHKTLRGKGSILRSFALQIASGMAYLVSDDRGHPSIIHRDLKARNCMVNRAREVKIADFGLSRHLDESRGRIKNSFGSSLIPSNSAPESMSDLIFNEKTDVWSYGTVLLELFGLNILTVPRRIFYLMRRCHSMNADERPTFEYLENEIGNTLTADEFEPIKALSAAVPQSVPTRTAFYVSISQSSEPDLSEGSGYTPMGMIDQESNLNVKRKQKSFSYTEHAKIADESDTGIKELKPMPRNLRKSNAPPPNQTGYANVPLSDTGAPYVNILRI